MRSVLLDVAETLRRDGDLYGFARLRNEDTTLLQVRLTAHLAGWIELRSTGTVRIPPAYLG